MYTVIRFEFREGQRDQIVELQAALNSVIPDFCDGEDRQPLRTSCELTDKLPWEGHLDEIRMRIAAVTPVIKRFEAYLTHKEIDIMIDQQDLGSFVYEDFTFGLQFLQMLVDTGLELTITVNRPALSNR